MSQPELPFVDRPAPGRLTVRLQLGGPYRVELFLFWGGDPTHTLGTDNAFYWDGRWMRSGFVVSRDSIMKFMRQKLLWHDISEKTMDDFFGSGVLETAMSDVESAHLTMFVMST